MAEIGTLTTTASGDIFEMIKADGSLKNLLVMRVGWYLRSQRIFFFAVGTIHPPSFIV